MREKDSLTRPQWWPHADFNELRIVTFLAIWLFLWDDALDEPTGEYADNFEAAQLYREETVQFLADTLGLSTSKEISTVVTYSLFDSFKDFGQQLKTTLESFLGLHTSKNQVSKASYGLLSGFAVLGKQLKTAVRWSLGMKSTKKFPPTASHHIIESFRVIGDELRLAYSVGKPWCDPSPRGCRLLTRF